MQARLWYLKPNGRPPGGGGPWKKDNIRMRRPVGVLAGFAACGILVPVLAAGAGPAVASGRAVGEITPSFVVLDVTGAHKGEPICYVCEYQGAPTVIAFFRQGDAETAQLIERLDELAQREKQLKFVAVLTSGPGDRGWLEALAREKSITIPLTVFKDAPNDRNAKLYKLNTEAANTILVSDKRRVTANLTNVSPDEFAEVEEAASRMLASR